MKDTQHIPKSVFFYSFLCLVLFFCFPGSLFSQSCTADFVTQPTSGCEGLEVWYTDNSVGADSWSWNFPGGTPSSAQGAGPHKVVYKSAGTFDASLEITCSQTSDTEYKKALIQIVNCDCEADFDVKKNSGCAPFEFTFFDKSTNATDWLWSFPGGTPSAAQGQGPHSVLYDTPGKYEATLQIQCPNGGSDSKTIKEIVEVLDCTCQADFEGDPTEGNAPLTVLFTDKSSSATSWKWDFPGGDPSSATGKGPHTVVYHDPGDFDVRLRIECPNFTSTFLKEDYIRVKLLLPYEYGDAPEGVIAYPGSGVTGHFPTCLESGPSGYIRHGGNKGTFLGNSVDHELEGNEGACPPGGGSYDQDESCGEADAGLWSPDAYTIVDSSGTLLVKPLCEEFAGIALGEPCESAAWGSHINLYYHTDNPKGAYVNVLIDWNQDGHWGGSSLCGTSPAPEHVLQNFHVPGGTAGHLSTQSPPGFRIGPNSGYVWARMTITETPIHGAWDGSGEFDEGETEDYLLRVTETYDLLDFGDAPFPGYHTLLSDQAARHVIRQGIYLGSLIDAEADGQPDSEAQGDDKNGLDDEDGIVFTNDLFAGDTALVKLTASVQGMVKVWIDFNQDKDWDDPGEMALDSQVGEGNNLLRIPIPDKAKEGDTFARFRFSTQEIGSVKGPLPDGEVEDMKIFIRIRYLDFGDAPAPFPTSLADDGAYHWLLNDLYFGGGVDWEDDGTSSENADADDLIGEDDEDGIEIRRPIIPGYHFELGYFLSGEGYVSAWIDFNGDGDWDDSYEHILLGREPEEPRTDHPELPIMKSIYVPPDAVLQDVAARFRVSSSPELPYHGGASDGEVEDYLVPIGAGMDSLDWGDAPDPPYPTLAASDGARHIVGDHSFISMPDTEDDGLPNYLADGDDSSGRNDENGIRFITPLLPGEFAEIEYWAFNRGYLNAWIDFNADGDWRDPQEHCINDLEVSNPGHPDTVQILIPESAINGYSYARFRCSRDAGVGYTGLAVFGNVEDYRIMLGDASVCESDSLALVALYHSTNGDEWEDNTHWLEGPIDTWYGVETDGCRVTRIMLTYNNLTGTLPREIGNFSSLQSLYLHGNHIGGPIPQELTNLRTLRTLSLNTNEFTGPIPLQLDNLDSIEHLSLGLCELTGTIPEELGELATLRYLDLHGNQLEGPIPASLFDLTELRVLYLGRNAISGTIPSDIGRLVNLEKLDLSFSGLSGSIPSEFFDLVELREVDFKSNELTGSLAGNWSRFDHLEFMDFKDNQFEGEIPSGIYSVPTLTVLELSENRLTGMLSPRIGDFAGLTRLSLAHNDFYGELPGELALLTQLNWLDIRGNRFTRLPDLSALSELGFLGISDNRFTFGDIEPHMGIETHYYAPQDSLGSCRDTTLAVGDPFEIMAVVDGSANQYQWKHRGVDMPAERNASLRIPALAASDSGLYSCHVTNMLVPDLTLVTRPVHLHIDGATGIENQGGGLPKEFHLAQNHPNPFNPATQISYHLPRATDVRLAVYTVNGQQVRILANGTQSAGIKTVTWNARDDRGRKMSSGIYFYRLQAGDFIAVKKMLLLQ